MRKRLLLFVILCVLAGVFASAAGQNSVFDNCWGKTRSEVKRLYPHFDCPQSYATCKLFDGDFGHAPNELFFVFLNFTSGSYSYVEGVYAYIPEKIIVGAGWPKTAERASAIAEIILGDENYYTLNFGSSDEIYMIYPKTNIGCQVKFDGYGGFDVNCLEPYSLFDKLEDL